MSYIDADFIPRREYWRAMISPIVCPVCNYTANGTLYKWKLLDAPVDAICNKCGYEWSIAIARGDSVKRREILDLLHAEKRFYTLREELASVIRLLHGDPRRRKF